MKPLVWAFWAHEPPMFYRRRHSDLYSQLGNGEWVPEWMDRIHSEEAIAKAAAMGINEIYTHFYKGFGLKMEHDDMMRTAETVKIAHKYGIKVIGYCTIGTYYPETLEDELPGAEKCARIDMSGQPVHPDFEGGFFSRNYACYNASLYYDEYYPKIIEFGLNTVKLDGFHFDNASSGYCRCPKCVEAFREFLRKNVPDPKEYALHSFDHVTIPGPASRNEPLRIQYLKYRRELCAWRHQKVFRIVKRIKPDAIVLYNCGLGQFPSLGHSGYDTALTPPEADQTFIESNAFIRYKEGKLITAVLAYKLGRRFGLQVLNTSWLRNEHSLRIPETEAEMTRIEAESLIFGSDCGSNWLARPLKSGHGGMVIDTEPHHSLLSNIFHYYLAHPELYAESVPTARVKLVYHPDSRLMDNEVLSAAINEACSGLLARHIPFSLALLEDDFTPEDTVVLPGAVMLSAKEIERIKSLPCRVICTGSPAGIYGEKGEERCTPAFPQEDLSLLSSGFEVNCEGVLLETALTPAGERLVHLLNTKNEEPLRDVTLKLPFTAKNVTAFSCEPGVTARMAGADRVKIDTFRTLCTLKFEE